MWQRYSAVIWLCVALVLMSRGAWAQAEDVSLGDAARRARQQQQLQKSRGESEASAAANRLASQLAEQMEASGTAPAGYKFYVAPSRAYSLVLPELAEPVSQEDGTVVMETGGDFALPMTIVLGAPMPARGDDDRVRVLNGAKEFLGACAAASPATVNGRVAAWARFSQCNFGKGVTGEAVFMLAGDQIIPVVCGYHQMSWNFGGRTPTPRQFHKMEEEQDQAMAMREGCQVVLNSVRPAGKEWQPQSGMTRARKTGTPAAPPPAPAPGTGESLAEIARATRRRQAGVQPARVIDDTDSLQTNPNSKPYSFNYCLDENCYSGSIVVPKTAEALPQTTYAQQLVFPVKGGYAAVELEYGQSSERGPEQTDKEYLDNLKGYPEGGYRTVLKDDWWDFYTPNIISTEDTTIAGYPARITRSHTTTPTNRIQVSALVGAPGRALVLRCSCPDAAFAEFEPACLGILDSLRVKQ